MAVFRDSSRSAHFKMIVQNASQNILTNNARAQLTSQAGDQVVSESFLAGTFDMTKTKVLSAEYTRQSKKTFALDSCLKDRIVDVEAMVEAVEVGKGFETRRVMLLIIWMLRYDFT